MTRWLIAAMLISQAGCQFLPKLGSRPSVHNPFPQLSRVAVAPFFNLSTEPTVDGRQFALAYYNELQLVPGFEVVPIGVVEHAIQAHQINLGNAADARRLAQLLEVDAIVIGAITDFYPYYPPRCGLRVEWYASDPSFQAIPPGYGLPWGTPEEEQIPQSLVFEAEMAQAKAQLAAGPPGGMATPLPAGAAEPCADGGATGTDHMLPPGALTGSPDMSAFIPGGAGCDGCPPSNEPVLRHTRTYNGQDAEVTAALSNYVFIRDDGRFGGWQAFLQRSDDYIRFCCHLHIAEMLSARGGAGETRVVWRWPPYR
jgi:hypothetical protein